MSLLNQLITDEKKINNVFKFKFNSFKEKTLLKNLVSNFFYYQNQEISKDELGK